MFLQVFHICMINWIKISYSANIVCSFCAKTNHLLERCQKNKKIQRKQLNFEWLETSHWSLEAKLLEQSYQRIYTHVQPYLIGDIYIVDGHECFIGLDDTEHDWGSFDVIF